MAANPCAPTTDPTQAIVDSLTGPASASNDKITFAARGVSDLITADTYLRGLCARKSGNAAIIRSIHSKISPPGTVG